MKANNLVTLPSVKDRQRELSEKLFESIEASFPMYTYKELKRLLRCEYHRFVMELRDDKTWEEITALTGMSRAGLNKLGDEQAPATHHNSVRSLCARIIAAGSDGIGIGPLAAAFYELDNSLEGPDFRDCLTCLIDAGLVTQTDGRYVAPQQVETGLEESFLDATVSSFQAIASRIQSTEADQQDRINCATLLVRDCPEAYQRFYDELKAAVLEMCERTEQSAINSEDPTTHMTLILGGSPNV